MKVLVVGGGGREHAIAWKIAKSPKVTTVFVSPGNGGIICESKLKNVDLGALYNPVGLVDFALKENIDLTIVGPEKFLVEGIVDLFRFKGLKIIGPTKLAARLEGSKNFSKSFMSKYSIPTAKFKSFSNSLLAKEFIKTQDFPIVIKADGLASGKGVTIALSPAEANHAIEEYLEKKRFGSSGSSIVIEEFLAGNEVSFIALTDGKTIFSFPPSQDHKRLLDNDTGPNTGGMGAFSPVNLVDKELHEKILEVVMKPTIHGMSEEGAPFTGFLYAGLMIQPNKDIKVLEYNCRLGDPETQISMMQMNGDFFDLLNLSANNKLDQSKNYVNFWDSRPVLGVVVASKGYPEKPNLGKTIEISTELDFDDAKSKIFHAGTALEDGILKTVGGRVLCLVAQETDFDRARKSVYLKLKKISFQGMQYRWDIAKNVKN